MKTGYVYRHWIINDKGVEKSYIGITTQELNKRWMNGKGYTAPKFRYAIDKYGWNNFNHEILETIHGETKETIIEELKQLEVKYIALYDSFLKGYNGTEGGDHVELRRGENHPLYGKKLSEEHKKKFEHKGEKNPMYGKTHSEETKRKIGEAVKEHFAINGHPKGMLGKHHSEEHKRKRSEALKGSNNPGARTVKCIETGRIFSTIKEASEWCGLKSSGDITNCCKGKQKTAGKHPITGESLHWEYYVEKI